MRDLHIKGEVQEKESLTWYVQVLEDKNYSKGETYYKQPGKLQLPLTQPQFQGYVSRIYGMIYVTNTDCFEVKGAMSPGLDLLVDFYWGI